jgi:hypothetical protein
MQQINKENEMSMKASTSPSKRDAVKRNQGDLSDKGSGISSHYHGTA